MTIGPEAANIAPGRIVVTIAYFFSLGGFALIVGVGPIAIPSPIEAKLLGAASCTLGVVLLSGAIGLLVRAPAGRAIAIWSARSAMVLALTGVVLGAVTVIGTTERPSVEGASAVSGGIVVLASLGNGLLALACLRAIRATRRRYFREKETELDPTTPRRDPATPNRVTSIETPGGRGPVGSRVAP